MTRAALPHWHLLSAMVLRYEYLLNYRANLQASSLSGSLCESADRS
jgi:hypothetical protein